MKQCHKIVLIGPIYPYRGGIAHFSEALFRRLEQRSHEVRAITFTRQYPGFLFPGRSQYEEAPVEHPAPSTRIIDSLNPITWFKAVRQVVRWGSNVAIIPYWTPFLAPALCAIAWHLRVRGVTVLALVHNALPHERLPGARVLGGMFLRTAQGCIIMSEGVGRDLDLLGVDGPRKLLNHPVYDKFGPLVAQDQARAELGISSNVPVLLFFGFIRAYKGLHVLLESMPRIIDALPSVRLIIAGEFYEEEELYRTTIESEDLKEHILLRAAYIPKEDVGKYFGAADVVVQPYTRATQSGVAQVAFHFEKPLIMSDVGGLAEVVGHQEAGLIVPPNDPDALSEAVIRFFEKGWRPRLTEGVRRRKQAHSWENFCEAIESMI